MRLSMMTRHKIELLICTVLTTMAMYTCIRVEIFNVRAGGYLPRKSDADWGISTWRTLAPSAVRGVMEKQFRMEAELQGRPADITPAQEAQIAKAIESAEENAAFRGFVETFGLAQYIVAPLAAILGYRLATGKKKQERARWLSPGLAILSGICIVMMFYRGYFTSLGW